MAPIVITAAFEHRPVALDGVLVGSRRVRSAASIESSIARWRRSSACEMRGNASRARTNIESPKSSSVQIISPTLGEIRNDPEDAAVVAIYLSTYEIRPATRP